MANLQELSQEKIIPKGDKLDSIQNNDTKQKIDIINSSELKKLSGFSKFIKYLGETKNKEKLDTISKAIKSGLTDDVKQYIDLDSTDWEDILNDDSAYDLMKESLKVKLLEKSKEDTFIQKEDTFIQKEDTFIQKEDTFIQKEDTFIQKDDTLIQKDDTLIQKNQEMKEVKKEINKTKEEINKLNKYKSEYKETKDILKNNPELKYLYEQINIDDIDWLNSDNFDSTDDINDLEKTKIIFEKTKDVLNNAKKSSEKVINILKDNKEEILKILLKESEKTGDTSYLEQIANNFLKLEIIDETRHNQIIKDVIHIKNNSKDFLSKQAPIIADHEQRGDTLTRHTYDADFTIKDGVIICKGNKGENPMKIVDYSSHDKETKAFMKKAGISSEIKELNGELKQNELVIKALQNLWTLNHNKNSEQITDLDINYITNDIGDKIPTLKDSLLKINTGDLKSEEKLKEIIWILYSSVTGSTNPLELGGDESNIEHRIFRCNQKTEDKNYTIRKKILEKEKIIKSIDEEFPGLSKEEINKKIEEKENRMQNTIKFCDDYGLSALGNIANIKKVIKLINEEEKKHSVKQIPEDIGTGSEFMQKETLDLYAKYMSRLFNESGLYKNGGADGLGLQFSYNLEGKNIPTSKGNLEKSLNKNNVLTQNGELNNNDKYLKEILRTEVESEIDITSKVEEARRIEAKQINPDSEKKL